jgi:hypothetical protein
MEKFKFRIEFGEYMGGSGSRISSTDKVFDTVVSGRNIDEATRMLEAQFGGQERARVTFLGRA